MSDRSLLGLDEEHSFFEKLKLFLVLLLVGPLIGLVLFAAVGAVQPPWNSVALHASQTLGLFWAMLLVFIWWRPAWFRTFYLWIEWKVVFFIQIMGWAFLLWIVAMAAYNVLQALGFV